MKLSRARVQNYRSIRDTGWFDVEDTKTILVGPNEAGKTALLRALQQIKAPSSVPGFDALRDFPRALYDGIKTKEVDPEKTIIVWAEFVLEDADKSEISPEFRESTYRIQRFLSNKATHDLVGGPAIPTYGDVRNNVSRLLSHIKSQIPVGADGVTTSPDHAATLAKLTSGWSDSTVISGQAATALKTWLEPLFPLIKEGNAKEEQRYKDLLASIQLGERRDASLKTLSERVPVFVLFSNYFRVRPSIHLEHLATRSEGNLLDDDQYDYGNLCLLKLLGFSARELSNLGKAPEPPAKNTDALKAYRDQLDTRKYQLNAASVRLTNEIRRIWQPDQTKGEASTLRIDVDGQYLKVVVVDSLGVEIELDQRSEGFQWLVSFFIVFFAESAGVHANAILLLDEPGLSLHGLKQREFRSTVTRLAEKNQTLFTTHSPFLVGPDELDKVRVIEMTDRTVGTKVHTSVTSTDPAALLPLQEALGYDLAQSLFMQQSNLVLEGLTDYWYIDATANPLRADDSESLDDKIALLPAKSAGKVVYFATILHSNKLKVAALLDSDAAGDQAAKQETLVHTLGNKRILRTKDSYVGPVKSPEIEDMLRETLVNLAKSDLGWDVSAAAAKQPERPIIEVFADGVSGFSKYRLAKAYLRWTRDHTAADLTKSERGQWIALIKQINKTLS